MLWEQYLPIGFGVVIFLYLSAKVWAVCDCGEPVRPWGNEVKWGDVVTHRQHPRVVSTELGRQQHLKAGTVNDTTMLPRVVVMYLQQKRRKLRRKFNEKMVLFNLEGFGQHSEEWKWSYRFSDSAEGSLIARRRRKKATEPCSNISNLNIDFTGHGCVIYRWHETIFKISKICLNDIPERRPNKRQLTASLVPIYLIFRIQ